VLQEKLLPYLKSLSADERKELPKMGDKTIAFVQKALEYSGQNAEFVPSFLDVKEFENDMKAVELLRSIFNPLSQISDAVQDTLTLSGSDAYSAALIFYSAVKSAAKTNAPKSQSILNDLSSRFPGRSVKK